MLVIKVSGAARDLRLLNYLLGGEDVRTSSSIYDSASYATVGHSVGGKKRQMAWFEHVPSLAVVVWASSSLDAQSKAKGEHWPMRKRTELYVHPPRTSPSFFALAF